MNKQNQGPSIMCCCGRSEHGYKHANRHIPPIDLSDDENDCFRDNTCRHNHLYRNKQPYNNRNLNNQSWNYCSPGRQKVCPSLRSEMEEISTANNFCHPRTHASQNRYENASLLRKANDLIDYAPESEFLKKMKQQCQYLQSCQPNIFSTLNEFVENEMPIYECQKCSDNLTSVSRRGEPTNSVRSKCLNENSWKCNCNQTSDVIDLSEDRVFFKNFANGQRLCREKKTEEEFEKKEAVETTKKSKKKSEHVSRSKKPDNCKGRRKRKSNSLEKCYLDQFEPSLKKPHENSCERCWRFASPARSPVNKPDQKYDPNFRRGHSYMDLEKGDGDLMEKESLNENVRSILREKARSLSPPFFGRQTAQVIPDEVRQVTKGKCSSPQSSVYSSTKVKELLNTCSVQKPLEKYLQSSEPKDKPEPPECNGILYSDSGRKPKPKSYTPGLCPTEIGRCPRPINDFTLTDYKTICMNPKKQCFNIPDNAKTPLNLMPTSYRETCATKGRSPSGPGDLYNLKSIPKEKYDSSKVTLPKTSKNLSDFEGRSTKTDSTAQSESSPHKKELGESTKSDASKIKGNEKSDSAKPKSTMPEKKTEKKPEKRPEKRPEKKPEKKSEKKPEKKSQKKTPQPSRPQTSSDKNRSSKYDRDKVCDIRKEKSQSARDSVKKEYHFNPAPTCGSPSEHNYPVTHPVRDCSCYPRLSKSKNNPNNQNERIFCCHCNWGENQKSQTGKANPYKTSAPVRPNYGENERYYREPNIESNDRRFMNNPDTRSCGHTHKSTFPESNCMQSSRGGATSFSCPYRNYYDERTPLRSNTPENSRYLSWENERRTSRDYRCTPGNQDFHSDCSPRKYLMFYMTKYNEKKKGDDIEVLVEELAQSCPDGKDTRTNDIADKMKKIMECPSDSMALRFQKGVSEVYKTPPSSRVLYF